MFSLRRSIILLFTALISFVALFIFSDRFDYAPIKEISLNVGTEIFGILLTVGLIDAVIRRKEQAERERIMKVAFAQMRPALQQHVTMLMSMYKASLSHAPSTLPLTFDTLFGQDYFVQIAFFDFSKPAPIMSVQPLQWFDFLHTEVEQLKASLTRTIEKYAAFLDADSVELLEALLASHLLSFLTQVRAVPQIDKKQGMRRDYNFFAGQGMAGLVRQHIDLITRLATISNKRLPEEKAIGINAGLWRDDIAPRFGSARV